jgi:hypothetical protein
VRCWAVRSAWAWATEARAVSGLGLGHGGGAGGDGGLLLLGAGVDIGHGGGQGRQIGFGLGQGGAGVRIIQSDQNLARLDALVVLDQDFDHLAADARADGHGVGLDEGVVGAFPALLALPPDEPPDDEAHADHAGDDQGQALLERGGEGHGGDSSLRFRGVKWTAMSRIQGRTA